MATNSGVAFSLLFSVVLEKIFKEFFTIYGHGSHLGHVTRTILTNFGSPILRSLHMKLEFNWPSGFRGEDF